jgi:hypothetical protein
MKTGGKRVSDLRVWDLRRVSFSRRYQVLFTANVFKRENGWVCREDGIDSRSRIFFTLCIEKLGERADRDPDRRVRGHKHTSRRDEAHDLFCQLPFALCPSELQSSLNLLLDHFAPFPMKSSSRKDLSR